MWRVGMGQVGMVRARVSAVGMALGGGREKLGYGK